MFQREIENNAYAKVWRDNKEYHGIFEKGLYFPAQQSPAQVF